VGHCYLPPGSFTKTLGVNYHFYADNTQLYVSCCSGGDDQVSSIGSCLEDIRDYYLSDIGSGTLYTLEVYYTVPLPMSLKQHCVFVLNEPVRVTVSLQVHVIYSLNHV